MKTTIKGVLGIIVAIGSIWYFIGGGIDQHVDSEMNKIESQVAADAVQQYNIVKRNGSAMDAYVQAGLVCAAFLQAGDEANYGKWKTIEKEEAKRAGIPLDN